MYRKIALITYTILCICSIIMAFICYKNNNPTDCTIWSMMAAIWSAIINSNDAGTGASTQH